MQAKIFLLLLSGLTMFNPQVNGQSAATTVLATGGGTAANGNIQVAWTLGEPIIQTAGKVTQGFHSAYMQVLSVTASPAGGCLMQVFPNPVDHTLTLQFKGEQPRTMLRAVVWNILGQPMLVAEVDATAANYDLDCTSLVSGAYWMEIRDQQGAVVATATFIKK
ncbi:MAG: T9SS type A sorting domain-containing protein [Saprospiraceae bacterium]|nr:T9SS type A sorting domain-containing protein [Saprospiraceae bacterium]